MAVIRKEDQEFYDVKSREYSAALPLAERR
jgi:hypothetical protein